jgi:hypothetical protein
MCKAFGYLDKSAWAGIHGSYYAAVQCNLRPIFLSKDATLVQVKSAGVAKVLQSGKNTMEILEAVENETLESHSRD